MSKQAQLKIRRTKVLELRRQGLSLRECGDMLGVSREAVRRDLKALGEDPGRGRRKQGRPAPEPVKVVAITPETARLVNMEQWQRLREASANGSVSAARDLARLSHEILESAQAAECAAFHVTKAQHVDAMLDQFNVWRKHLDGPLASRMALEFELDEVAVHVLVLGVVEDVSRELNRMQGEEEPDAA